MSKLEENLKILRDFCPTGEKKKSELYCYSLMARGKPVGPFAESVYDRLSCAGLISDFNSCESPDFILESDSEVIGLEHFQIDFLVDFTNESPEGFVGKDSIKNQFDDLLSINQNSGRVITGGVEHLKDLIRLNNSFDYKNYVTKINRIFDKHAFDKYHEPGKLQSYLDNIKSVAGDKSCRFGFVVEIPYSRLNRGHYDVQYLFSNQIDHVVDITTPVTLDLLEKISNLNDAVDFVIVCLVPINVADKNVGSDQWLSDIISVKNETHVFYFDPKNVDVCRIEQKLKAVCSFDIPNCEAGDFTTSKDGSMLSFKSKSVDYSMKLKNSLGQLIVSDIIVESE